MAGFFKINRQIEQHWIWNSNEAFDKRSAWIDLIMKANFIDKIWSPNSKENILIKRGSFSTSELKLSNEWKWDRGKVRRFLKALENDNMIERVAAKNYILITIINYSSYQDKEEKCYNKRTTSDTADATTDTTTENVDIASVKGIDTTTDDTITDTTRAKKPNITKEIRIKNKDIKKIFLSDSNEYRLADYLRKYILRNNPSARVPDDKKIQNWCKTMDLMLRLDKRTVDDAKEHIHFSQTDTFWSGNILSPTSLREKYDQLTMKMKTTQNIKPKDIVKPASYKVVNEGCCPMCKGKGVIKDKELNEWVECPECKGGKKVG